MKSYETVPPVCPTCKGTLVLHWLKEKVDGRVHEFPIWHCIMCTREYNPETIGE